MSAVKPEHLAAAAQIWCSPLMTGREMDGVVAYEISALLASRDEAMIEKCAKVADETAAKAQASVAELPTEHPIANMNGMVAASQHIAAAIRKLKDA